MFRRRPPSVDDPIRKLSHRFRIEPIYMHDTAISKKYIYYIIFVKYTIHHAKLHRKSRVKLQTEARRCEHINTESSLRTWSAFERVLSNKNQEQKRGWKAAATYIITT